MRKATDAPRVTAGEAGHNVLVTRCRQRLSAAVVCAGLALAALAACVGAPATTQAARWAICATQQLRVSESSSQGAAGTWLLALSYRNVWKKKCLAEGYPAVTLYDQTGNPLPNLKRAPLSDSRPRSLLLAPSHLVYGVISYPDNVGSPCRAVAAVRIIPPEDRSSTRIGLRHAGRACGSRRLLVYPLAASAKQSLGG
jgi:hypothetical protein